ncbi:MAG: TetR/AcrR family transcriptional regulator [Egibacteraceae bacterium]
MEQRTRLSASQRRAQLVEVAGRLFAERGYHTLSMEQLADAAGVSKPVFYQHFPSKRDLYLALLRDAVSELDAQVRKALEGASSNRERVRGAVSAYFDFVEDRNFRLLFDTAELREADVRETVHGALNEVTQAVAALIAEDAGLQPHAAQFLASGLLGLALDGARWWAGQTQLTKDEAVQLLTQLAWRGLGSFDTDKSDKT